jgi:hypothetical protein
MSNEGVIHRIRRRRRLWALLVLALVNTLFFLALH